VFPSELSDLAFQPLSYVLAPPPDFSFASVGGGARRITTRKEYTEHSDPIRICAQNQSEVTLVSTLASSCRIFANLSHSIRWLCFPVSEQGDRFFRADHVDISEGTNWTFNGASWSSSEVIFQIHFTKSLLSCTRDNGSCGWTPLRSSHVARTRSPGDH
jgi:hypothetical protein